MKIDSFFDTFEKRILFVGIVYLISSLIFSFMQFMLGIECIKVNDYETLLQLVNQYYVNHSFLGRNALTLLNIPIMDGFSIFIEFILNFKSLECIYFGLSGALLFSRFKKQSSMNILVFILMLLVLIICFILGFQSGSVFQIIFYLHVIGFLLTVFYGILFLYNGYILFQTIKSYRESLKYEAVII